MNLAEQLKGLAPAVLAAIVRRYRDFAACEDAMQEALAAAAAQWPRDGIPANPRGWLFQVASRRLTDQIRADAARRHREEYVVSLVPADEQVALIGEDEQDDTLDLLFLCCHPSLTPPSQIALTLRAVGGLTTAEIAKAFLVPEATMAQRISRAKQTVKDSGEGFGTRGALTAVMHVLYLIFNEGYAVSGGAGVVRTDLSAEAIRLTRMLARLTPGDPEVAGLLALMLLTDARRAARTGPSGELIPLDQQDRARWDAGAIAEGVAVISAALPRGQPGPYQLQAAIAALHDEAPSTEATDWPQILALYDVLMGLSKNPLVALNRAIAVAMVQGPRAGLALVEELAPRLAGNHRVDAVRGHLLERAGDLGAAAACFRKAAARTDSIAERDYLLLKAASIDGPPLRGISPR